MDLFILHGLIEQKIHTACRETNQLVCSILEHQNLPKLLLRPVDLGYSKANRTIRTGTKYQSPSWQLITPLCTLIHFSNTNISSIAKALLP